MLTKGPKLSNLFDATRKDMLRAQNRLCKIKVSNFKKTDMNWPVMGVAVFMIVVYVITDSGDNNA